MIFLRTYLLVILAFVFSINAIAQPEIEMVFVEGGPYLLETGSCDSDVRDIKKIEVVSFYIGKYEVTQAQWQAVMGDNPSGFFGCGNCPVDSVSWNDVQEFVRKLNVQTGKKYRLPTEAEWEYASKGGRKTNGSKYSGSNNLQDVAWYEDNSENKTHKVGLLRSNELGIYDMTGNVKEWCLDLVNFELNYICGIMRGGSIGEDADWCTIIIRDRAEPDYRDNSIGFRLVLPVNH
jgi:formylglycine-generating enzyme required for sulfatase activity